MKTCARIIRRIVASKLRYSSWLPENVKGELDLNVNSFSHHCLLSCRYVMFQIFSKSKWGQGPPAPRSDDTASNTTRCSRR